MLIDGIPHYGFRQFVVEADGSTPGVPAGTNLAGVVVTARSVATGEVLTARYPGTGDVVSLVTDDRGETPDLVYYPDWQLDVSASGSKVYRVFTSDMQDVRDLLDGQTQAAEGAASAAASSAQSSAEARNAAAASAAKVDASEAVTLATRLFGPDWQTVTTLLPAVVPAGAGGGSLPDGFLAEFEAVKATAYGRDQTIVQNADGTFPDEPTGDGPVVLRVYDASKPVPAWVATRVTPPARDEAIT